MSLERLATHAWRLIVIAAAIVLATLALAELRLVVLPVSGAASLRACAC